MRPHVALAAISLVAAGCTAFVAANLAGTNGTVQHYLGGCFQLADTTCGQCIANNCEDPNNASQPVSLQKVCTLNQYSLIISAAQDCSKNTSINNYNCTDMYIDGGTYAASIDNEQAAVNNLKQCITQNCKTSCNRCAVEVPTCGSDTIDLLEAGACGVCIDQAINSPGGDCQQFILGPADLCSEYPQSPVAQCAIPAGSCQTADCSQIQSPSSNTSDAGLAYYACLRNKCGSVCPSQ